MRPRRSRSSSSSASRARSTTSITWVASASATSRRACWVPARSATPARRWRTSWLMAYPNRISCITGTPTIIPKVSRSRRSWRTSLRAMAPARDAKRISPPSREWRRRRRPPRWPTPPRRGPRPRHAPTPRPAGPPGPRAPGPEARAAGCRAAPPRESPPTPSSTARAARTRSASTSTTVASIPAASSRGAPSATSAPRSRMARAWQRSALVHVVGRDQDRRAGVHQPEEALPEVAAALRVHRTGGLVQEQQLRLVHQRGRQGQALALPAGERSGKAVGEVAQAVLLQQRRHPLAARCGRERVNLAHELEVLAYGEVLVEREALGHVADAPAQGLGVGWDRETQHVGLTGAGRQEPAQHANGGGLARSVGAEEAVDPGAGDGQVHGVDGQQRSEAAREAARGRSHRSRIGPQSPNGRTPA